MVREISNEKLRTLRTNKLKRHREGREGALFCYGLQEAVLKIPVYFALSEADDYDLVTLRKLDDTLLYTPVQMKEVPPERLNPTTSLNKEIQKLTKYVNSENLVVAIHANRTGQLNFNEIVLPKLKISELWIFGSLTLDQSRWFLYGDVLTRPEYYEFNYPTE